MKNESTTCWVTGAKGFIGVHLAKYLSESGLTVYGIGHGIFPEVETKLLGIRYWIKGEINAENLSTLENLSGKPYCIYHLAGGSSVGYSIKNPLEDFRRTVISTAQLLDWTRIHSAKTKIVVVSSAAVYGNQNKERLSESDCVNPFSPYGYNKRAMELLCKNYSIHFNLSIAIVRLFSVYGPLLRKQLLWDLCCKLESGVDHITMSGTGQECRDFINVFDSVRILLNASKIANNKSPVLNGGTGIATRVEEIVKTTVELWPAQTHIEFSGVQRAGDPFSLVADINSLSQFNFIPQKDICTGIKEYIGWFKAQKGESQSKR